MRGFVSLISLCSVQRYLHDIFSLAQHNSNSLSVVPCVFNTCKKKQFVHALELLTNNSWAQYGTQHSRSHGDVLSGKRTSFIELLIHWCIRGFLLNKIKPLMRLFWSSLYILSLASCFPLLLLFVLSETKHVLDESCD